MKKADFVLTKDLVQKVLNVVDVGLSTGLGIRVPGEMCVEAAVCYAMGMKHGDAPTCVHPAIRDLKISLNDSDWSSRKVRAAGMRRLAVLQLGTKDSGFDEAKFTEKLAIMTVRNILPVMLTACGSHTHSRNCLEVTTLAEAIVTVNAIRPANITSHTNNAANAIGYATSAANAIGYDTKYVARYAASAARYVSRYAASDARYVDRYAASDAADNVLRTFATGVEDILIEMNVPAVSFLSLID